MCAIAVLYVVKCLQARYEVKDILQVWYEKSPLACKINRDSQRQWELFREYSKYLFSFITRRNVSELRNKELKKPKSRVKYSKSTGRIYTDQLSCQVFARQQSLSNIISH